MFVYRIVFFLAVALTSSALIIERTEVDISTLPFHTITNFKPILIITHFTGSTGSFMGRWCVTRWNSFFTCRHSIRSDVWSNSSRTHFHDYRFWSDLQWWHFRCYRTHTLTGNVRNVFRFCYIGHLWIRTKCHSTCSWLILSNTVIVRCHLANWRNAIYFKVITINKQCTLTYQYNVDLTRWSVLLSSFNYHFENAILNP